MLSLTSDGPLLVNSTTTYTAFDHVGKVATYSYDQAASADGITAVISQPSGLRAISAA